MLKSLFGYPSDIRSQINRRTLRLFLWIIFVIIWTVWASIPDKEEKDDGEEDITLPIAQ